MSEQPLPEIVVPTANSKFNDPAGDGFVRWFAQLAQSINLQAIEVQARTLAKAARQFVGTQDQGIPRLAPDQSGWAHLDVDATGNVIGGVRVDGSTYVRALDSPSVVSVDDERLPQIGPDFTSWQHVDLDGEGNVISGIRMDGTHYFRRIENTEMDGLPELVQEQVAIYAKPGPPGEPGQDGLPGVNAVNNDEATGVLITTPGTQTAKALTSFIAPVQRLTDTGRGAVVLTIDDGFAHMRTMANMMNARGQRGTFCITPDLMNNPLTKIVDQDVIDFAAAGHEIAAHSKSHANMKTITTAQRQIEYNYPKTYLENLVGAGKVTTWAYPYGTASGGRDVLCDQQIYLRYDRLLDTGVGTGSVLYPRYDRFPPFLINRTGWTAENHEQVMSLVRRAASSAVLVPIFFHDVDTPVNPTRAQFTELLDTCQALGIPMITTSEAFPNPRSLLNAGFETITTDQNNPCAPWRTFRNGTNTREVVEEPPAEGLPGKRSLHLVTTDAGYSYVRQQVQVVPGVEYTLSLRARAVSGANLGIGKTYARIRSLDYGQASTGTPDVKVNGPVAANTTWDKYTVKFTPGQTCRFIDLDLVLDGAVGGARVAYDHVWFEPSGLGDLG